MSTKALEKQAEQTITQSIAIHRPTIKAVLGKEIDEKRWLRLILGELRRNPGIAECNPDSIVNAVLIAASMQVEIGPEKSYLIPFGPECTLIIDYRQKVDLARRSGLVRGVHADVVCENDEFDLHIDGHGEVVHFRHKPALLELRQGRQTPVERGAPVLAYAIAGYTDGEMPQFAYLTKQKLDALRDKALQKTRKKERSPWSTHEEEMQIKSALRKLCKLLPHEKSLALSQEVDIAAEGGGPMPSVIEIDPGREPINVGSHEEREKVLNKKLQDAKATEKKLAAGKPSGKQPSPEEPKPEPAGEPAAMTEEQMQADQAAQDAGSEKKSKANPFGRRSQ
jgi:recombination protein RecT